MLDAWTEDVVLPADVCDAESDKKECKGATGNAGAIIDKLYKNAALLVWLQDRHLAVLGLDKMIKSLDDSVSEHVTSELTAQECLELVRQLLAESKCPYRKPSTEASVIDVS